MGKLTTHILDTANGKPGAEIELALYRLDNEQWVKIADAVTNDDGRTNQALLADAQMQQGKYQLVFQTANYFRQIGTSLEEFPFLDDVVIRFGINDTDAHYHVPLLVSPYSFSTYRGS